jgi:hypothetical protein
VIASLVDAFSTVGTFIEHRRADKNDVEIGGVLGRCDF